MDRRTTGIVATIAAVLLCGCPGLFILLAGFVSAAASQIPGAEIDMFGRSDPQAALNFGLASLCLGAIFVIIPIVVGVLTLRNRPAAQTVTVVTPPDEPLPPAS